MKSKTILFVLGLIPVALKLLLVLTIDQNLNHIFLMGIVPLFVIAYRQRENELNTIWKTLLVVVPLLLFFYFVLVGQLPK